MLSSLFESALKLKILADVDIFLEFFLQRPGYGEQVETALEKVQSGLIQIYITDYGLEKLRYFLSLKNPQQGEQITATIGSMLKIIKLSDRHRKQACDLSLPDFESAVEVACAHFYKIPIIITQNPENFAGTENLPSIWTLSEFVMRMRLSELRVQIWHNSITSLR